MKLCPSCGKQNIDRAKFCGYCGSTLTQAEPSPAPQEWRSDETVKASPIFIQEIEMKSRPKARFSWVWPVIFLFLAAVVSAGWLLLKSPPASAPVSPQAMVNLNPFQESPTPGATATVTATITPTATVTVTPTIAFSPTPTLPPVGIGVRRQDLASPFLNLGYAFQDANPVFNQPRWIGRSIDNTCSLEIVGQPQEIIRATFISGPSNVGDQDMIGISYMNRFLGILVPEWKDSGTWLKAGLRKLTDSTEDEPQVSATAGNKIILLSAKKSLELTILSVQGAPAAP